MRYQSGVVRERRSGSPMRLEEINWMWKCLFLAAMIVAVAAVPAAALPVCNEGYDAGVDVTTITQCTVGPFIFSNFSVSSGLNMAGARWGCPRLGTTKPPVPTI